MRENACLVRVTGWRRRLTVVAGTTVLALVSVLVVMGWEHILFHARFEGLGLNAQGYPEYRHRETGIVFVALPAGTFRMGTSAEDAEAYLRRIEEKRGPLPHVRDLMREEMPMHEVELSPFMIAKYEVPWKVWKPWGREYKGWPEEYVPSDSDPDLPVVLQEWDDYRELCETYGFTLPTEAQWEYACRAGTTTTFSFGDKFEVGRANLRVPLDAPTNLHDVHSGVPDGFGLHHMHGNASELCLDRYDGRFYDEPESRALDPVCVAGSSRTVVRGGESIDLPEYGRCASRDGGNRYFTGFRPVMRLP